MGVSAIQSVVSNTASDLNLTGQAPEDFAIFSGANWQAKGGVEKIITGSFTRDMSLASGNQSVTGVGFIPSCILFLGGVAGTAAASIGFSDNVNSERFLDNRHAESANVWLSGAGSSISVVTGVGLQQFAVINSFDSDGFTLTWTKVGAITGSGVFSYLAYR